MTNNKNKINNLEAHIVKAVEEYQCPGCFYGINSECYEISKDQSCDKHVSGTMANLIGKLFIGMPKGFNRLGEFHKTKINIFEKYDDGWGYNLFNVPVWKHLDKHNNTLVRGICPRINHPFIHVFLEDCIDKIDCLEITHENIEQMD